MPVTSRSNDWGQFCHQEESVSVVDIMICSCEDKSREIMLRSLISGNGIMIIHINNNTRYLLFGCELGCVALLDQSADNEAEAVKTFENGLDNVDSTIGSSFRALSHRTLTEILASGHNLSTMVQRDWELSYLNHKL